MDVEGDADQESVNIDDTKITKKTVIDEPMEMEVDDSSILEGQP